MSSRQAIIQFLATCSEVYSKEVSTQLGEIWLAMFEHQDTKDLQKAFSEHLERSQYFPKPADINRLLTGSPESQSLAAWTSVIKTVARLGSYASVRFEDPLIVPIIQALGGWQHLCLQTIPDLVWVEKAFHERYLVALDAPLPSGNLPHLAGILEQGNARYDRPAPVHLVTLDGSTPSPIPALGSPHADERITTGIGMVLGDKAAHVDGEGAQ